MATVSNTCNGSYGSDCRVYLDYVINNSESDRIARNKSNITLTLYAQATSNSVGAYNYNHNSKAYIYINNAVKKSATNLDMDFRNKKKVNMISWTGDVDHNADGTLAITIKGSFDTNGPSSITTGTVSYKWTLPTIPRTSSITCSGGNIGSNTTININRASSSFTHTLTYSFQGLTGTIATKTTATSVTWTIPTSFYAKLPNSNSGTGTITCQTYSGSSLIGTSSTSFTAYVTNSSPSITATVVDTNSSSIAATGDSNKLIKYISNAQVTVSAVAKNSATISNIKVVNGSKSATGSTTFSAVDSGTFNLSCTDSRGLTASNTITKTIVDYITPTIVSAVFARASTTSDVVNATISGKAFNGSFGAKTNTFALQWRYKESTASSYGDWLTLTATRSGNNFSFSGQVGTGFNFQKEYNIEARVSDYFKSNSFTMTLTRGLPIVDIGKGDVVVNGKATITGLTTLSGGLSLSGVLTSPNNNFIRSNNEFNYAAEATTNVYINYRAGNGNKTTYPITDYKFYNGQMNGNANIEGKNVYANGGLFKSTNNGNVVTIGSQNASYCHIYNSANIPFYFNKDIQVNGHIVTAPVVAYNNSSGTSGTVTMSESAANYKNIRISYKNDDGQYGSTTVAQGGNANCTTYGTIVRKTSTNNTLMINSALFTVSGTTITISRNTQGDIVFGETASSDANKLYITKVELWN